MSVRFDTINALIAHIASETSSRGYRGLRFLHEINDFPSFYVHVGKEQRIHNGRGTKLASIECDLRGYIYSDKLDDSEIYARQLESAIDSFSCNCEADSIKVTSVRTDEGLMLPYSVIDLTIQVIYRIEQ